MRGEGVQGAERAGRSSRLEKGAQVKVVLTFEITGTEDDAWAIAEALEEASRKRGYLASSSWVEMDEADRANVLGAEGGAEVKTSAESRERRPAGSQPMGIGGMDGEMVTLGDDDGRSIN